ncbi:MAG TPA: DUF1360 domain-containing protein, partial [Kofleriaceae bacterium]|nr:DUF1360 domain-containing protein [Kofleriaceae bacterium]
DGRGGYGADPDVMPLGGYAALVGLFTAAVGGFLGWASRRRRLPHRVSAADIVLLGVATQKLTRLVGRDFVTAPLRAPFTRYQGSLLPGEVKERSRGHGLRRAVGDLLTCEYCLAPWISAGLFATHALNPPLARFIAAMTAAVSLSDAGNHLYLALARAELRLDATSGQRPPALATSA